MKETLLQFMTINVKIMYNIFKYKILKNDHTKLL